MLQVIVGSRHCSKDSLSFTSRVAWAAYGSHAIIGGLTYGIEETAQQAILPSKNGHWNSLACWNKALTISRDIESAGWKTYWTEMDSY